MKIVIEFGGDADIIEVPKNIEDKLNKYQHEFLDWLSDESINHKYWKYENGKKIGLGYRSDAFIEWLNIFVFTGDIMQAKIIEDGLFIWDETLPAIYF